MLVTWVRMFREEQFFDTNSTIVCVYNRYDITFLFSRVRKNAEVARALLGVPGGACQGVPDMLSLPGREGASLPSIYIGYTKKCKKILWKKVVMVCNSFCGIGQLRCCRVRLYRTSFNTNQHPRRKTVNTHFDVRLMRLTTPPIDRTRVQFEGCRAQGCVFIWILPDVITV